MFVVCYTNEALKFLAKLPEKWRSRITKASDGLAGWPYLGKKLHGKFEGLFAIRVWPYRVIYQVQKEKLIVVVVTIGHRQGIYN